MILIIVEQTPEEDTYIDVCSFLLYCLKLGEQVQIVLLYLRFSFYMATFLITTLIIQSMSRGWFAALTILVEKEGPRLLVIKSFQAFFSSLVAVVKVLELVVHELLYL